MFYSASVLISETEMFILHFNPIYVKHLNSWKSHEAMNHENYLIFHCGVDYHFFWGGGGAGLAD